MPAPPAVSRCVVSTTRHAYVTVNRPRRGLHDDQPCMVASSSSNRRAFLCPFFPLIAMHMRHFWSLVHDSGPGSQSIQRFFDDLSAVLERAATYSAPVHPSATSTYLSTDQMIHSFGHICYGFTSPFRPAVQHTCCTT